MLQLVRRSWQACGTKYVISRRGIGNVGYKRRLLSIRDKCRCDCADKEASSPTRKRFSNTVACRVVVVETVDCRHLKELEASVPASAADVRSARQITKPD